jgi:HPt (histidine-containing phosphotransfer) domain-containing protein
MDHFSTASERQGESLPTLPDQDRSPDWQLPAPLAELAAADSGELVSELIGAFTSDTRSRLHNARKAAALGDFASVRREAHTIKGGALQLGADNVATICRELEIKSYDVSVQQLEDQLARLSAAFIDVCVAMSRFRPNGR